MKIRKSTVVVKTLAQKAKEAKAEANAKKLAAMQVEFRKRDKKALALEKELGENEHAIKLWSQTKNVAERKLSAAQKKYDAAMRRIDREKKQLTKKLAALERERAAKYRILAKAASYTGTVTSIVERHVKKTPKLQAKVDAAFKRKNSLEDRIAKSIKAPKEYDLSK